MMVGRSEMGRKGGAPRGSLLRGGMLSVEQLAQRLEALQAHNLRAAGAVARQVGQRACSSRRHVGWPGGQQVNQPWDRLLLYHEVLRGEAVPVRARVSSNTYHVTANK